MNFLKQPFHLSASVVIRKLTPLAKPMRMVIFSLYVGIIILTLNIITSPLRLEYSLLLQQSLMHVVYDFIVHSFIDILVY